MLAASPPAASCAASWCESPHRLSPGRCSVHSKKHTHYITLYVVKLKTCKYTSTFLVQNPAHKSANLWTVPMLYKWTQHTSVKNISNNVLCYCCTKNTYISVQTCITGPSWCSQRYRKFCSMNLRQLETPLPGNIQVVQPPKFLCLSLTHKHMHITHLFPMQQ